MFFEVTFGSLSVPKLVLGLILGGTKNDEKRALGEKLRNLGKGGGAL